MNRPILREIPIPDSFMPKDGRGEVYVTMSQGQWDEFLANSYLNGFVLLELDEDENIVTAYQADETNGN